MVVVMLCLLFARGVQAAVTMHNIGYMAQGYNIFYGNPKPTIAGADPGFSQFAGSSIFQHTYTGMQTTADDRYLIPDGFDLQVDLGCALDFVSFSTSKTSAYTSDLKVDVGASGPYDGGSFSASADYQKFAEHASSSKQRMVSSIAECAVYKAELQTYNKPNFTDNFVTASSQLPADYGDGSTYFDFIDAFGTHYPVETVFGSRYGFTSYFDEEAWTSVESTSISVEVAASYEGVVKAGGNLSTQTETSAQQAFSLSNEDFSIVSLGTPPTNGDPVQWAQQVVKEPMPIMYTLVSLCTAVPENVRDNCNKALSAGEYCTKRLLQSRHAVSTCNEVFDSQCIWDRDCGSGQVCSQSNQCETAPRQEVHAVNRTLQSSAASSKRPYMLAKAALYSCLDFSFMAQGSVGVFKVVFVPAMCVAHLCFDSVVAVYIAVCLPTLVLAVVVTARLAVNVQMMVAGKTGPWSGIANAAGSGNSGAEAGTEVRSERTSDHAMEEGASALQI